MKLKEISTIFDDSNPDIKLRHPISEPCLWLITLARADRFYAIWGGTTVTFLTLSGEKMHPTSPAKMIVATKMKWRDDDTRLTEKSRVLFRPQMKLFSQISSIGKLTINRYNHRLQKVFLNRENVFFLMEKMF
ncbi:hypothetical protein U1Q18_037410 [Sarracenia purpurea var. burkii]